MNRPYIALYHGKSIEKNPNDDEVGAHSPETEGEAHKGFWGPALFLLCISSA